MKTTLLIFFTSLACASQAQKPRLVAPTGHALWINAVAFSPDGKYILTGSEDKTAKLWDLEGHELQVFSGHDGPVLALAFSPDGKYVLTGSKDRTALLWNLQGQIIQSFNKPDDEDILSVAFSPNGKYVLTGNWNNSATLWGLNGKPIRSFEPHADDVKTVAFSPPSSSDPAGGRYVLTASTDTVKISNLDGRVLHYFTDSTNRVGALAAFSPDGKYLATAAWSGRIILWDWPRKRKIRNFSNDSSGINAIAFSPDSKAILTGNWDNSAKLWDLNGKKIKDFIPPGVSEVRAVAFSPKAPFILTGKGESARLWDMQGNVIREFTGYANAPDPVSVSPGGQYLLTAGWQQRPQLWDLKAGKPLEFPNDLRLNAPVAFSPDGQKVLTSGSGAAAKLWDWRNNTMQDLPQDSATVSCGAFSPDGQYLLTGAVGDTTVRLWNLQQNKTWYFPSRGAKVRSVAFSSDGQNMLIGGWDTVALLNLQGHVLQYFTDEPIDAALSPVGEFVLVADWGAGLKLVDWQNNTIKNFPKDVSMNSSLAFSPDGQYILTTNWGPEAKLWNRNADIIQRFTGHTGSVFSAVFFPDGKKVLTASRDNTLRIWDTQTGRELAALMTLDTADWVVTTPSGLFDASPGAMNRMYYVQGLEVIELEQLKKRYWEPGLLAQITRYQTLRDVSAFGSLRLYPEIEAFIAGSQLHVKLRERSGGMGKLSLFVNGKELAEDINPAKKTILTVDLRRFNAFYLDTNTIALRAFTAGDDGLRSRDYNLTYLLPGGGAKGEGNGTASGASSSAGTALPRLYAIVVGTSRYTNSNMQLRFPDADAEAMKKAIEAAGGSLFPGRVYVQLLSTAEGQKLANRANVKAAFDEFKAVAQPTDILVVYFSGHGKTYNGQFYYLTRDVPDFELKDAVIREKCAISSEDLTNWIKANRAQKQVLIFDACNAGSFADIYERTGAKGGNDDPTRVRAYDEMKDRTGTFIIAGAAADKSSYEDRAYGHGLLTYSLLEGMKGHALLDDERVDVMKLFLHALKTVPQMAKYINKDKEQTPMLAFPKGKGGSGETFSIGQVDEQTKQKMPRLNPPSKSIYLRPSFINEGVGGDKLKLEKTLADYLRAREDNGKLIYLHADENENGYQVSGIYRIVGGKVELAVYLNKAGEQIGKFNLPEAGEVPYLTSDVQRLVEKIVEKVQELVE